MDEKALRTSPWQRVIIILVAILLLGSTVLTYMFIVMSNSSSQQDRNAQMAELENQIDAKNAELAEAVKPLSDKYFKTLQDYYKSQVKAYNATAANDKKLEIKDLKEGTGTQLQEKDINYNAYYIGWCADGKVFDSSFAYAEDDKNKQNPTGLQQPLVGSSSMIEGWIQGIIGMKIGGVRQLSIPGELAYKDETNGSRACGAGAPLKFIVMMLPEDEDLKKVKTIQSELSDLNVKLYMLKLGGQ